MFGLALPSGEDAVVVLLGRVVVNVGGTTGQ